MPFKITKASRRINGVDLAVFVAHDGEDGTGVSLPFICGFCVDKDGKPTVAFRSQKERLAHASVCKEGK